MRIGNMIEKAMKNNERYSYLIDDYSLEDFKLLVRLAAWTDIQVEVKVNESNEVCIELEKFRY